LEKDAMNSPILQSSVPILAALDISQTLQFYSTVLGFTTLYEEPGSYGIAQRNAVQLHFWACPERHIAQNTACRIQVGGIDALYAELQPRDIIHPNAPLQDKPWGTREFAVLDENGNQITFFEQVGTDSTGGVE
jgi:catechol 2,3-dioxygenase-like lactoylglutathione lyase family enzyme